MKVLHITSWYPNNENTKEAIWIKRHIESLDNLVEHELIHLQIKPGKKYSFYNRSIPHGSQKIFYLPTNSWFFIELISTLLLLITLLKARTNKRFDIINFHIAYPNLTYWHLIKKFISIPVVITEHWSAYHFNFGVAKSLPRIQRIFKQNIPIISVSQALINDIEKFSNSKFPSYIVPNIVDEKIFYPDALINRDKFFFMVSQWSQPKNPFVAMEAFLQISKTLVEYKLIIGGYGNQWAEMKKWVDDYNLSDKIKLVGSLESTEVANYLRTCTAFIHPSNYETFSVVCAEAVSCNSPVIASCVGGIKEVVKKDEGILINLKEEWGKAMKLSLNRKFSFEKANPFSKESVSKRYFQALNHVSANYKKSIKILKHKSD